MERRLAVMNGARPINTVDDVQVVLASKRASFSELQDCVEIANAESRWDLAKSAAERSLKDSISTPNSQDGNMEWALGVIVSVRLKAPANLEELPNAINDLMDWIAKLRARISTSRPVIEVKFQEERLATVLVLLANPDPPAMIQLCSKLRQLDRPDLGVIAATRAIERGGDRVRALTTRGAARSDQHKYREAIDDFEEVLGLDPRNSHALTAASRAYQEIGNLDAAMDAAERAMELAPENVFVIHRMLSIVVKRSDLDLLEGVRRKLKDAGSGDPEAHRLIDLYTAEALFEEERYAESRAMVAVVMRQPSAGELAKRLSRLRTKLSKVGAGDQLSLPLQPEDLDTEAATHSQ